MTTRHDARFARCYSPVRSEGESTMETKSTGTEPTGNARNDPIVAGLARLLLSR